MAKKYQRISRFLTALIFITTALWTLAFFSIYTHHDVRITASKWLGAAIPSGSSFLVEGGNMVDLPLGGNFQKTSLDFYTLEDDIVTRQKVIDSLSRSDYFLVQSRRVFLNHRRLSHLYPKTAAFYQALFDGRLGFVQIKEFNSFPRLEIGSWKLEVADETAEETWSVFDHPVVRVFKKNRQLSQEQYREIIEGRDVAL